ncbi:DHA3 family tetracycline resistance protein-like MFS transporter [Melghirimyces profundicolus]|uniref:DHA3 family tetracycline resistance protein-like MFS transporter n=2 Tax=Melghirimyces profundicolus TaxID=1242148 RepID=A0A2T6BGB4_9BACL|nr:DHA3 family tetracycline resistance protein-like MFS transporter [Melghirimyces profundicolus]
MFAYHMYLVYMGATAFLFAVYSTAASVYRIQEVGLDAVQLLWIGFALEVSCFLFEIPTGVVADLYSRKRSMAIGLLLTGCGFLLEGSVPLFGAVLGAQVLWGVGYTFLSGADQAWIADERGGDGMEGLYLRGAQVAQFLTLAGMAAGTGLASYDLSFPLQVSGVMYFALALFVWLGFPENRFTPSDSREENTWRAMWGTFFLGVKAVRASTVLVVILGISLFSGLYSEGFDRLYTLHLLENFRFPGFIDIPDVVWIGGINAVAMVLNIIAVEWIQRRFQKTGRLEKVAVLLVINSLMTGSIFAFAVTGEFWMALAAYWITYILRGTNQPIYNAWIHEQIRESHLRATILSTQGQIHALGEILGGPLVGAIVWRSSAVFGLIASSIILAPVVLLYLMVWRERKGKSFMKM